MKKFIAVILSFLILGSASGIAYGKHYCGDYLLKSSFVISHTHLNCGMQMQTVACDSTSEDNLKQNHCCSNELTKIQTDQEYQKAATDQVQINKAFVQAFVHAFILNTYDADRNNTPFLNYKPPLLTDTDILILYQTFLI